MGQTATRKETEVADPWMSLRDAASELGISRQTVLTRIVAGELEGMTVAGRTVVRRSSVAAAKRAKATK